MSLSLPIINNIITEKILNLEIKLENNESFYKSTILNLTNQINLLVKTNTELNYRIDNLERGFCYKISQKNLLLDTPPGLKKETNIVNIIKNNINVKPKEENNVNNVKPKEENNVNNVKPKEENNVNNVKPKKESCINNVKPKNNEWQIVKKKRNSREQNNELTKSYK